MKKYLPLVVAGLIIFVPTTGFTNAIDEKDCVDQEEELNPEDLEFCGSYKTIRDGCDIIYSCRSCIPGRTIVSNKFGSISYNTCEPTCNNTNCVSSAWMTQSVGYETRTNRFCENETTCNETIIYRCAAGYYGTTTDGTTGCTRCPSSGGVYGKSASGSTDITSCYLPSGTSGSDSTGSFTYTGNCYYVN